MPKIIKAVGQYVDPLNKKPAQTAPILAPTPTMPAIEFKQFLLINDTTEYVAPSDICTNNEKKSIVLIAKGHTVIREKISKLTLQLEQAIIKYTLKCKVGHLEKSQSGTKKEFIGQS